MAKRPNFLFVITDQQRADYLACAGHPVLRTPNIDSIAEGGRRFNRFYVATPVCMPNRSTLMTGRMPSLHGVRSNGTALNLRANTFVDLMRTHGYRTALLGKSHLQNMTGMPAIREREAPPEDYLAPPESFMEAMRRVDEDGPVDVESPHGWHDDPDWDLFYPFYGFERVDLCTEHGDKVGGHYWQWLKERHADPGSLRGPKNALPHDYTMPQAWRTAVPEELYPTRYVADRTVDFLETHAKEGGDAPFFAMASFPDPHHPFTPPGKYWGMYDPDDMTLDASFAANNEPPPHVRWARETREAGDAVTNSQSLFAVSEREAREACALTCGMIAMIDDAVGEILGTLDRLGLADDTVVIFTADHGDYLGDHRIMLKGPIHYQSLIRVPFLWRDTADRAAPAGANSATLSGTLDIARTVLDRARIAPYNGIQGKSLMPLIDGAPDDPAADIVVEDDQQRTILGFDEPPRVRTLVTQGWRMTLYHGVDWGELYDLENDPSELVNLWDDPSAGDARAECMERLARQQIALVDRSPMPTNRA